ncbi:sugar transferase [Aurantiacibacter hainanensis]|uniref:sugar transferase n=1 Tax=Aurantiacibacter hainanensis TaxID=3076114 RepID=UPI0030C77923
MDLSGADQRVEAEDLLSPPDDHAVATPRLPTAPRNGLAGSLERKRLQYYLLMLVSDIVILVSCFAVATIAYYGGIPISVVLRGGMAPGFLLLPLFLTIALYNNSYSLSSLTQPNKASLRIVAAILISAALLNFLAFFAKGNAEFSRVIFTSGIGGSVLLMIGFRFAFTRWLVRRWGPNPKNQLVIYDGGPRFTLPYAYHVDAEEYGLEPTFDDPTALDRLSKFLSNMDEVIVSCSTEDRVRWAEVLKGSGRHGEIVSEFTREIGALGVIHHSSANVSSLLVSTGHLGMRSRVLKRMFDVSISLAALIVLSPLMLFVALAIKLHDGGPVFFLQRRMGRGNQFFDIYKFRSMSETDANGDRSASRDDDRVTPIGRFIRRTSIDELPQLINVLKGDMSRRCSTIRCATRRSCAWRQSSSSSWQDVRGDAKHDQDSRRDRDAGHRDSRHPCAAGSAGAPLARVCSGRA